MQLTSFCILIKNRFMIPKVLTIGLILSLGCSVSRSADDVKRIEDNNRQKYQVTYSPFAGSYACNECGALKGEIVDAETKEPLIGATVLVVDQNMGAVAGIDGEFTIKNIPAGTHQVEIKYIGYETVIFDSVRIRPNEIVVIEAEIHMNQEIQPIELKPMLYFYPEDTVDLQVELEYGGEILHSYPKMNGQNWRVKASPDGTLIDASGRQYYGLFWEGSPDHPVIPDCGFVVSKDSLVPFLENALDALGLNFKEANEFMVFWLPILEQNEYNLIHFDTEDYVKYAQLKIQPKPDHVIRLMMCYKGLKKPIVYPIQTLPERPIRSGFTVVEWGGSQSNFEQFAN